MSRILPLVMLLSVTMTVALILLGINFLQADRTRRQLERRLDRVSGMPVFRDEDDVAAAPDPLGRFRRPMSAMLAVTGVDLSHAGDYPLPWWAILLAAIIMARISGFLVGLLVPGLGWLVWLPLTVLFARLVFGALHARRASALLSQFPDALATIVRCVRVGIPVQEALRLIAQDMPGPTNAEFARIADRVAIGTPFEQALRELADRAKLPEYGFFATAISLQARHGGGLAQTLDGLADVIRKRVAAKARGYALSAEARTSSIVLGIIPIFAAGAIEVIQPSYLQVLFVTHQGHLILGGAIGLLLSGALVMREIIRRSLG